MLGIGASVPIISFTNLIWMSASTAIDRLFTNSMFDNYLAVIITTSIALIVAIGLATFFISAHFHGGLLTGIKHILYNRKLKLVFNDPKYLNTHKDLTKNKEFMIKAIESNPELMKSASEELRKDQEFILRIFPIGKNKNAHFNYIHPKVKNSPIFKLLARLRNMINQPYTSLIWTLSQVLTIDVLAKCVSQYFFKTNNQQFIDLLTRDPKTTRILTVIDRDLQLIENSSKDISSSRLRHYMRGIFIPRMQKHFDALKEIASHNPQEIWKKHLLDKTLIPKTPLEKRFSTSTVFDKILDFLPTDHITASRLTVPGTRQNLQNFSQVTHHS